MSTEASVMVRGKRYFVPSVRVRKWWRFEGWIPVMGPMHEDAIVNFPSMLSPGSYTSGTTPNPGAFLGASK